MVDSAGQAGDPPRPALVPIPYAHFIRPEQLIGITTFSEEQIAKYSNALAGMWNQFEQFKNVPDSQQFKSAVASLTNASNKLRIQIQQSRGLHRPMGHITQTSAQTSQNMQNGQQAGNKQLQPAQPQQYPQHIIQTISSMSWLAPGVADQSSPEAQQKITQLKRSFAQAATQQLQMSDRASKVKAVMQQMQTQGKPPSDSIAAQLENIMKQHEHCKGTVQRIRAEQEQLRRAAQLADNTIQSSLPIASAPGISGPTPQPFNLQMPVNPRQDSSTAKTNTMMAPNQPGAANGSRPGTAQASQTAAGQQQTQNGLQATSQSGAPPKAPQGARPQMNAQASGSQQGATSNTPPQAPTVAQAVQNSANARAQSFHSNVPQSAASQQAPPQSGFVPPNPVQVETVGAGAGVPKMPISKTLSVPPPVPVQMAQGRPTMAGPSNGVGAPGVMGQPVIQKPPGFQLEGDDGRVLSKKKLDELVRQVTGSDGGGALSGEVEEAMLQIADDFIDDVVAAACRLAKMRDSATLEIRDIQIILERNYNIRIPGYSTDEVRAVRKFHPAPGWQQKMNAIQAAKVMGGKSDA